MPSALAERVPDAKRFALVGVTGEGAPFESATDAFRTAIAVRVSYKIYATIVRRTGNLRRGTGHIFLRRTMSMSSLCAVNLRLPLLHDLLR